MRDTFEYRKYPNYPHMSMADTLIWERFIDLRPETYIGCQYDFHVGDAPPFNTLDDDGTDRNQDKLYRLRIDVVGHTKEGMDVIEIKPSAGPSSIGQIQSNRILFIRDEEPQVPVRAVIITDREMPNMYYLCKQAGVVLVVV